MGCPQSRGGFVYYEAYIGTFRNMQGCPSAFQRFVLKGFYCSLKHIAKVYPHTLHIYRAQVKAYTIVVERLLAIDYTTGPLTTLPQPPRSAGTSIFDTDTLPVSDQPKLKSTGESNTAATCIIARLICPISVI